MASVSDIAAWARAISDPNRVRIIAICAGNSPNVREIAESLQLSDPLISHHLKALHACGLVFRERVGRRVEYSLPPVGPAATWLAGIRSAVDAADPQIRADRAALARLIREPSAAPATREAGLEAQRLEQALLEFCESRAVEPRAAHAADSLGNVCIESDSAAIAAAFARRAATAVVKTSTPTLAARLRKSLRGVTSADTRVVTASEPREAGAFDLVVLDRSEFSSRDAFVADVDAARAQLVDGKSLVLFVAYDVLAGDRDDEHPLLHLRRLLSEREFRCDRIQPVEVGRWHLLAAAATVQANPARRVA
jgi:DNA-binding transcriptional ArsR family regulator